MRFSDPEREAARERCASIERSPILRAACRDLAERVMALVKTHPPLGDRLLRAPPEAFHISIITLRLTPDLPAEEVAQMIHDNSPKALLGTIWPDHHPRLLRALRRVEPRALILDSYRALDRLLHHPSAEVFDAMADISAADIWKVGAVADLDPLVMAARAHIANREQAVALHELLRLLRREGIITDDDQERRALAASKKGLGEYVMRRLRRMSVPEPLLPRTARYTPIRSLRELHAVGRKLRNCLGSNHYHAARLLTGASEFGVFASEPEAVVRFKVVRPGVMAVAEIAGPENVAVPKDVVAAVIEELEEAGATIMRRPLDEMLRTVEFDVLPGW